MTHIIFSTNLTMSPQIDDFLKKPPFLNLSSYCSGSVSVTIRIIKQKTQSDKPVGLTWLWSSVNSLDSLLMNTLFHATSFNHGYDGGSSWINVATNNRERCQKFNVLFVPTFVCAIYIPTQTTY